MRNRYMIRALACGFAALAVLVAPVLADELIGRITAVDIDAKKLTVKEKGTDKDVDVTVNDETVVDRGKGKSGKVNLEKMKKNVEKAKDGVPVEITHDKGVASKIVYKGAPPKKDAPKNEETKKDKVK
ncbi:MAG: hypothetical protein JWN86_3458 [Planctomycetota bacterium]|nr:hypothetical protein [Planctomycetota bacterium]